MPDNAIALAVIALFTAFELGARSVDTCGSSSACVTGDAADLAWWLTGRGDGATLTVDDLPPEPVRGDEETVPGDGGTGGDILRADSGRGRRHCDRDKHK